jgi:hypothetical protein
MNPNNALHQRGDDRWANRCVRCQEQREHGALGESVNSLLLLLTIGFAQVSTLYLFEVENTT